MYLAHVHELDRLVEIKDDNDALTLARIALWRQIRNVGVFIFDRYDHGNGVVLTQIEPIIEGKVRVSYKDNGGGVEKSIDVEIVDIKAIDDAKKIHEESIDDNEVEKDIVLMIV